MDLADQLILAIIIGIRIALHALTVVFLIIAAWNLFVHNRLATHNSLKNFNRGSGLYTKHGMIYDHEAGVCKPDDTPIIRGKNSVIIPLLAGFIMFFFLWLTDLLLF